MTVLGIDGEIYLGKYGNSNARAYPDGGVREFVAGITVGQTIGRFRPYGQIETLFDEVAINNGKFHPGSVRYNLGIDVDIWKGIYLGIEHECWHPVDRAGTVEEYNLITIKYRFNNETAKDN